MNNISFFIPAYNCSATLRQAAESIIRTNFEANDELIIVDDYSTDDTSTITNQIQRENPDKNITLISHTRNRGGAAARNTAVENANHDLLFCLDSDNILADNSVDLLKKYLLSTNADVASFHHQRYFLKDVSKTEYTWSIPPGEVPLSSHLEGKNVPGQHGNYMFTKSSWLKAGGYAEGTGALDTATFGLRQAITGSKFVVLENTYYHHRLDYINSYWMRDAEANLWSVSPKAAYALMPLLHLLDESFVQYILGDGRYKWFYNLKIKPIKLAVKSEKDAFYLKQHNRIKAFLYPKETIYKRVVNKLKRILSN